MMKRNLLIKISVIVTYLLMVTVNALANILPINGIDTAAVSDSYPNLFAPAGITFSIWGIIYTLLLLYCFFQLGVWRSGKEKKESLFERLGLYFSVSSVANALWILSWHHKLIGLTVILMLVILFCLIKIADILRSAGKFAAKEVFLVKLPFSVYFGWITVATIANITVLLVSLGWDSFGVSDEVWMVIILFVATAIGMARMLYDRSIPYGLVFIWAFSGILFKHLSPEGFSGQYVWVIRTTVTCIILFAVVIASMLMGKSRLLLKKR